jgi:hypothetical protein
MGDSNFRKFNIDDIQRFDPSTRAQEIPTQNDAREMLHVQRQQNADDLMKAAKAKKKSKLNFLTKIYGTQIGVAFFSSLAAAGLLYWVNPPLTQFRRKDNICSQKQNWKYVLLACSLVLIGVFVGPEILSFLRILE